MVRDVRGRKSVLRVDLDTLKVEGISLKEIEKDIIECPTIKGQGRDLTPEVEAIIDHIDVIPLIESIAQGVGIVQDLEKGNICTKEDRIDLDQGVFQGIGIRTVVVLQMMVTPQLG